MSSLVQLGFSIIAFAVSYGLLALFMPVILSSAYTSFESLPALPADWQTIYDSNKQMTQYLVPLIPAIGIALFVIKVLMVASVRGRD